MTMGNRMTTTLYHNGLLHPYGPAALFVDGDTIGWVGAEDNSPDGAAHTVDLRGALVTPAFVDAHVHCTGAGLAVTGLNLRSAGSLHEALRLVEEHARGRRGAAVLGDGWDETRWPEHRPPTPQELDRASYGGVVYLSRIDGHSGVVSSALLAAAPDASALPGFSDSGWLSRAAHHAVRRAARATLSTSDRRSAQRAARHAAAQVGIGCIHELAGPETSGADDLRSLQGLAAEESGPDLIAYWAELHGVARARELGAAGAAGDLFADGAVGSRTAALAAPYEDDPATSGAAYLTAPEVTEHVVACTKAGLQAGFHAIGDAAVAAVVDGFSAAARAVGVAAIRDARHRIEHVEMFDAEQIAQLAALGIVASVQPAFDAAWGGTDGMYVRRVGPQRARAMNPFAALAAAGVPLAFGSDAPVTPLDPWGGVRAAIHHRTAGFEISLEAAFAAHTAGGWYAARRTGGSLVAGAPATFAVWDSTTVPAGSTLPDLALDVPLPTCLRTVVRGGLVHDVEGALG